MKAASTSTLHVVYMLRQPCHLADLATFRLQLQVSSARSVASISLCRRGHSKLNQAGLIVYSVRAHASLHWRSAVSAVAHIRQCCLDSRMVVLIHQVMYRRSTHITKIQVMDVSMPTQHVE